MLPEYLAWETHTDSPPYDRKPRQRQVRQQSDHVLSYCEQRDDAKLALGDISQQGQWLGRRVSFWVWESLLDEGDQMKRTFGCGRGAFVRELGGFGLRAYNLWGFFYNRGWDYYFEWLINLGQNIDATVGDVIARI